MMGIESFLSGYLDSLLTYGRAVGELVIAGGKLRAVCWGDVTALEAQEGESPLETVLWGTDEHGLLRPLPYQQLLLFTTMNPEPAHPYGVSMFRGMPFLADILLKIYNTIGVNWERAGNIRYSVICKKPLRLLCASRSRHLTSNPPHSRTIFPTAASSTGMASRISR